jgi:hypothetical protein
LCTSLKIFRPPATRQAFYALVKARLLTVLAGAETVVGINGFWREEDRPPTPVSAVSAAQIFAG